MPNIRQLAKVERKTRQWTLETMEKAMEEVRAGRSTVRQAAKVFGVPKSSLSDRVSGKVASGCHRGRSPYLTAEDENSLVEYCLYSASHGFPLTKPEVLAHALAIYNLRHPKEPKNTLGQTWWINFRERHQRRLAVMIPNGKADCTNKEAIDDYFRLLSSTMEEHGLREKPCQIYNCDEKGFKLDSNRRKGIVSRGTKHGNKQAQGTRDHITILVCFNAAGEDVPPFIIYKGGYPRATHNEEAVPHIAYGKSQTGYINSEVFRKWFVEHFLKYATQERPLLLILDDHQSHLDPELVRVAQTEGVILLCLPSHTSHILQPLDASFFGPLKKEFSGLVVSKKKFSTVLSDSYQRLKNRRVVVAGFRKCGLYPLDPTAIDWMQVTPPGQRSGDPTTEYASPVPPASPSTAPAATPSPRSPNTPVQAPPQNIAPAPNPPYLSHPIVAERITPDQAHPLAEINFTRNSRKVRRNTTKARLLTAQEMNYNLEEHLAAYPETKAPARLGGEKKRAKGVSSSATSQTRRSGSCPSRRRRVFLGAAPTTSSDPSINSPSAPLVPSTPFLPGYNPHSGTQLPVNRAEHHPPTASPSPLPTVDEPTVPPSSCLQTSQAPSSHSQACCPPESSSVLPGFSVAPSTPTGHTAPKRQRTEKIWRCGRCKQPDPPQESEGLATWVQCDNCHKLFHDTCVELEKEQDGTGFWCFWCLDQ